MVQTKICSRENCNVEFSRRYGSSQIQWESQRFCSKLCANLVTAEKAIIPLEERFFSFVLKGGDGGCWIWVGPRDGKDYGKIHATGRSGKQWKAHRLSYELHKGQIPAGMEVCHSCDNPSCVNPDHLWLGTHKQNMADCSAKKRTGDRPLKGEAVGTAKLDWRTVRLIRLAASLGASYVDIAKVADTHPTNVGLIVSGKHWKE